METVFFVDSSCSEDAPENHLMIDRVRRTHSLDLARNAYADAFEAQDKENAKSNVLVKCLISEAPLCLTFHLILALPLRH